MHLTTLRANKQQTTVGEIDGQKISLRRYQDQVARIQKSFTKDSSLPNQDALIRAQAWQQLITQITYQKTCEELGLIVSEDELIDMVQGAHIHPELQAIFKHPQTKQFDKQRLIAYLQQLSNMPEAQQAPWRQFEREMATWRQHQKLDQLMRQSVFVTTLEAQTRYTHSRATLHLKCLYIPYYTISDDEVPATDDMLKDYLMAHKHDYQCQEQRHVQYVFFPITATREDEKSFQAMLRHLKKSFIQATDDRAFVNNNTDGVSTEAFYQLTSQELPVVLSTQQAPLTQGMVTDPVQVGNVWRLYKITKISTNPEMVYDIAVVEKHLVPGDLIRNQRFREADYCAHTIRNTSQLADYATKKNLPIHEAVIEKDDMQVGARTQGRELVRWLYREASVGKVSPVFEIDHGYVVAIMTQHVKAGITPLAQVRDKILYQVRKERKATMIMEKLQALQHNTLEQQAVQYGHTTHLFEAPHVSFEDDTLQHAGLARKTIGTAFALPPHRTATIADENGVLVIEVLDKHTATELSSEATAEETHYLMQLIKNKQAHQTLQALKTLARIKDHRYLFY